MYISSLHDIYPLQYYSLSVAYFIVKALYVKRMTGLFLTISKKLVWDNV